MSLRVAIVGDALLDLTIAPSEPMRPGSDVPAAVGVGPGGQGANVAVRLARRGVGSRLACALSDDTAGRLLREALESEGVSVDAIHSAATGVVAILLGADGERGMLSQRVPLIGGVDLIALAQEADWLVVSGYALFEPAAQDFAGRCATLPVHRAILGCSLQPDVVADWRQAVVAARPDLLILNEDEALLLAGQHADPESLAATISTELDAVVMVTSLRAAAAAGKGLRLSAQAPGPSRPALDTTGAGDAFAATILAELGGGWPPTEAALGLALARALTAAGDVVAVTGAQTSIPSERAAVSR